MACATATGSLLASYKAFHPTQTPVALPTRGKPAPAAAPADSGLMADMKLNLPAGQLEDRLGLLQKLDGLRRNIDNSGSLEDLGKQQQQAYQLLLNGISQAFDLSKEDAKTLARYDTTKFTMEPTGDKKPKMMMHMPSHLGHQMLLARRLCEAGCGFITVGTTGWDMHNCPGNFGITDGMAIVGGAMDRAVTAFLEDVEERGLSDKILLVMVGEMGRTPKMDHNQRGHWGQLGPLLFAGGGLKMGQVIGQSDKLAGSPASDLVTPDMLLPTIMSTLFDVGELRVKPGLPVDVVRLITDGKVISQLFS